VDAYGPSASKNPSPEAMYTVPSVPIAGAPVMAPFVETSQLDIPLGPAADTNPLSAPQIAQPSASTATPPYTPDVPPRAAYGGSCCCIEFLDTSGGHAHAGYGSRAQECRGRLDGPVQRSPTMGDRLEPNSAEMCPSCSLTPLRFSPCPAQP
jgi:hypothetical protein